MGTILFFRGQSLNDAITDTIGRDVACLTARGHSVIVADMVQPLALPSPSELDLVVGYQGWGSDIKLPSGRSYIEEASCPYIAVLGDHPIHHAARILACPPNTSFCVGSRNQASFLKNALNVSANVHLLPAGVYAERVFEPLERDIGALFIGQVKDPEVYLLGQNLPPVLTDIIKEFAEGATRDPGGDILTDYMQNGFERVLSIVGHQPSAIAVGRLIDHTVRHQYRWQIAQALRSLPVTFVGDDWVHMERLRSDCFTALPSVPFGELASIYARAQVCLNLHPPYFDFHERIIDAMTQATAVATAPTEWLGECFEFGQEILALPSDSTETSAWLSALLADPTYLEGVGEAARTVVMDRFGATMPSDLFHEILIDAQSNQTTHVA